MSPYDAYLFITEDDDENFSIARFQIDNSLNIRMEIFMKKKEIKSMETKFKAKTQIIQETNISKNFNGYHITIKAEFIMVVQKN